jgi:hypothetical protein
VIVDGPCSEIVTVEIEELEGHVVAVGDIVMVEIGGHDGELGQTLQVVRLEIPIEDVVFVLVEVTDPAKQEHALESLEGEDEHGEAKVGIARAGRTVYV